MGGRQAFSSWTLTTHEVERTLFPIRLTETLPTSRAGGRGLRRVDRARCGTCAWPPNIGWGSVVVFVVDDGGTQVGLRFGDVGDGVLVKSREGGLFGCAGTGHVGGACDD